MVNSGGYTVARDIATHMSRTSWFARMLPECAISKNIYIYFNINFIRKDDGKMINSNNFFISQKFLRAITIVGHTFNEHQLNYTIIPMINIF